MTKTRGTGGARRDGRGMVVTLTALMALAAVTAAMVTGCAGGQRPEERRDPEVVTLEGALGNRFVAAATSGEIVARLRIGTRAPAGSHRPPINVALVIDTSGSMDGRPIEDARAATAAFLDSLRDGDRLAVVAFHSETEVVLPSTVIDRGQLAELRARVSQLRATGTTDLAGGLRAGIEEVIRHWDAQGINRVVLLSDGVPNDASSVVALAQAAGERQVAITALGLGTEYDETLLAALAQRSGGRFHFVAESQAVARVFTEEVLRMTRTLARNLQLQLRPGPGVRIESVVGQPSVGADGSVRLYLGDLAEGDSRDVIVRLTAEGRREGAMVEVMDAVLAFDDALESAGHLERRVFLGARSTASGDELEAGADASVQRDAARMAAAAVTVQAIALARGGELEQARAMLSHASARAQAAALSYADEGLAAQAAGMREVEASFAPAARSRAEAMPARAYVEHDRAMGVLQGE
jgi:Ca-activated chloride channel homolog